MFSLTKPIPDLRLCRESHERNFNISQLTYFFYCRTKSVTRNIRGLIERLLRAAQRVLGAAVALRTVVKNHCFGTKRFKVFKRLCLGEFVARTGNITVNYTDRIKTSIV